MTIVQPRPEPSRANSQPRPVSTLDAGAWWSRLGSTPQLIALASAAALLRLVYAGKGLSPDEAGFTLVARQWHQGNSLYGRFWVDRPPLLLDLYGLAAHLGTPTGLRLLGCLAAFSATLSLALCVRRACGSPAAFCTGAVAALGYSSVALGAVSVNGELLAAPFVAGSLWSWVEFTHGLRPHRGLLLVSGGCAAAAVLVKQNMLDGVVFFAVAVTALALWRRLPPVRLRGLVVPWVAGALLVTVAVLASAAARGTSITGVWYAMYPFRLAAVGTMQSGSMHAHLTALAQLAGLELLSLGPLIVGALGWLVVRARSTPDFDLRVLAPAVLAVFGYDVFSILAGGSFWPHYLVQLVVPTALAAGIVAARLPRSGRALVALSVTISLVLAVVGATHVPRDPGTMVGESVGQASETGDTIVSALGNAEIVQASGLDSDYEYLWSLPARTLDTNFLTLATLLEGSREPTWLVVRGPRTQATLLASAAGLAIRARYHVSAIVCGRIVYLADDVERPTPVPPAAC